MIDLSLETINDLKIAFGCQLTMNNTFFWKVSTRRVVEIHLFDYWYKDEPDSYEDGLDEAERAEVREAIYADKHKLGTHVLIPKLTVQERFQLMEEFADSYPENSVLKSTFDLLQQLKNGTSMIEFRKNGFEIGYPLGDLTKDCPELSSEWKEFYGARLLLIAEKWLTDLESNTSEVLEKKKPWWRFW